MSDGDRQPVLTGDALVDKINDVLNSGQIVVVGPDGLTGKEVMETIYKAITGKRKSNDPRVFIFASPELVGDGHVH